MSAEEVTEVLRRRAEELARPVGASADDRVVWEVVGCRVGTQRWGIPLGAVVRVVAAPPLTPLPGTPQAVIGVAQILGELMTVVSGPRLLSERDSEHPWVAVIQAPSGPLALAVSAIEGARRVTAAELEGTFRSSAGSLTAARTRDLLSILDVAALARDPRVSAVTEEDEP